MYPPFLPLVKDLRRTKDEPKNSERTPKLKMCVLLRLPPHFPLLYLPLFHRPNTDRRPREERSIIVPLRLRTPCCFLRLLPKKVVSIPKKVVPIPKRVDYIPKIVAYPPPTKSPHKAIFICSIQNNSLPLHSLKKQ